MELPYEHIAKRNCLRLHLVLEPPQVLLNFHLEIIWHELFLYVDSGCAQIIDVLDGASQYYKVILGYYWKVQAWTDCCEPRILEVFIVEYVQIDILEGLPTDPQDR